MNVQNVPEESRMANKNEPSSAGVSAASGVLSDSELWKAALDAAGEGITISDVSLPDNPIVYANAGFERMTGYDVADVVGRNCRFLQGGETEGDTVDEIRRAVAEGSECTVELLNYRKDGKPFWNRLSIRPLRDAAGKVTHFVGIQTDITRRRLAEENLKQAKRELEAAYKGVRASIEAAANVQRSLLPSKSPEVEGFEFNWIFEPCEDLAGDALNVIPLNHRYVAFYMLDVTGHGPPASLLSVTLSRFLSPLGEESILFLASAGEDAEPSVAMPSEVLERLNHRLPFDTRTSQFFTIFYGILDRQSLKVNYASAGHPPGIVVSAQHEPYVLEATGFPVGIVAEPSYKDREVQLAPGDRLVLYTDGLTETPNAEEEEFGPKRLMTLLAETGDEQLGVSLEKVVAAVKAWRGDASLPDDLSVLAVEVNATPDC
jgi:PAS domain S-box-containing protein